MSKASFGKLAIGVVALSGAMITHADVVMHANKEGVSFNRFSGLGGYSVCAEGLAPFLLGEGGARLATKFVTPFKLGAGFLVRGDSRVLTEIGPFKVKASVGIGGFFGGGPEGFNATGKPVEQTIAQGSANIAANVQGTAESAKQTAEGTAGGAGHDTPQSGANQDSNPDTNTSYVRHPEAVSGALLQLGPMLSTALTDSIDFSLGVTGGAVVPLKDFKHSYVAFIGRIGFAWKATPSLTGTLGLNYLYSGSGFVNNRAGVAFGVNYNF